MLLQDLIEKEQHVALDKDFVLKMSYRKNLKYLFYDDIKSSDTLKTLLPTQNSGVLILFALHGSKSKVGHFCLLFRNKRSGLHFFDSYGLGLLRIIDITGSDNKIVKMIKGHDIHINKHKFQVMEKGHQAVNTCGRHCITRWNCAHFHPNEYEDIMYHPSLDPDSIVTLLTLEQDFTKIFLGKRS